MRSIVQRMNKKNCFKNHYYDMQSICMVERFVLFHNTKFRIALGCHEFMCPFCGVRHRWFISH